MSQFETLLNKIVDKSATYLDISGEVALAPNERATLISLYARNQAKVSTSGILKRVTVSEGTQAINLPEGALVIQIYPKTGRVFFDSEEVTQYEVFKEEAPAGYTLPEPNIKDENGVSINGTTDVNAPTFNWKAYFPTYP